jgi:hypothetical protein
MTRGLNKIGLSAITFSTAFLLLSIACCRGEDNFQAATNTNEVGNNFLAGVRGGFSAIDGNLNFQQAEAYGQWKTPWRWNFCSDFSLRLCADVSAGWLHSYDTSAFIGTLGPVLEFRKGKFPIILEGGASPTIMSQHVFHGNNFGDNFQFTSYIGVQWEITKNLAVGVRIQHMSNAHIANPNPGLNMLMFSTSYSF